MAQLASAALGIVVDVVGFCFSALCSWRIRSDRPSGPQPGAPDPLRTRIAEGVRLVARDRNLRALTIIGGASNFDLTAYASLLVLYLDRDLGLTPAALGAVLMVGSVGGLVGALVAPPLSRRLGTGRASTSLLLLAGPTALLVALPRDAGHVYLSATGLLLVGLGVVGGNVVRSTWRQRYIAGHLLARVITTMQVVNHGTMPVAGLVAGASRHQPRRQARDAAVRHRSRVRVREHPAHRLRPRTGAAHHHQHRSRFPQRRLWMTRAGGGPDLAR